MNIRCVIEFPNNLRIQSCLGVEAHNNCDHDNSNFRYPHVILGSKLSLIIFIGSCGPVELLIVHYYVTQIVGVRIE